MYQHKEAAAAILLCSALLPVSSKLQARPITHFLILLFSSILLSILAVHSLSLVATNSSDNQSKSTGSLCQTKGQQSTILQIWITRFTGIIAAAYFLALPYYAPGGSLGETTGRAIFFACACKILDLTVSRAHRPPSRIRDGKVVLVSDQNRREYVWLLLRECRYHSFDIASIEKARDRPASTVWTFAPGIALPLLVYFVPCSETRFLLTLVIIHAGLEACHSLLHPSCPHRLFWHPFAAGSISDFWRTHWQQDAASFLYSLAYKPVKNLVGSRFGKQVGRAAGVMAAFNLSGIWHAWAAASLTTAPWRTGLGMWAIFVAHGALCLVESTVWRHRQGGLVQRVLVWSFAIWSTGVWLRDAEKHVNIPGLKSLVE